MTMTLEQKLKYSNFKPIPGRVLDQNDVYTTVAVGTEDEYCRDNPGARRVWAEDAK